MRARAGLFVALLALAAGCGGSTPSASEQWAGDVCGPIDEWATRMEAYSEDVRAAISSPSADSITTIQTTIEKGADATNKLADDLQALGPAPTSNGQTVSSELDVFAMQIEQTVTQVQDQAKSIQSGASATDIATAISAIASGVSAAVAQGKSTIESLQETDGELKDAFDTVDSCKQLKKNFG
jgi:ABC-type glycerol-3-phosphate transport system substrate-binding protein